MKRKIIHCDADCFFAALEIRDDPNLRGIPVAVGGNPGKRGVISTCNYEARMFGVRSAQASAYAKRLCPQLIILPHNMDKYRQAAQQMLSVFMEYTDIIEPVSLDEAYLDVSESTHFCGSATLIAQDIRRRIKSEVGITVSAGVAPNKFLAKVASDWDKPNGLTVVEPSRVKFFLNQLPVSCIPGVGRRTCQKLEKMGVQHCVELQSMTEVELTQEFGQFGRRLYDFCRGDDNRKVVHKSSRRSLSVEHTYDKDIPLNTDTMKLLEPLYKELLQRLRKKQLTRPVKNIFVKLKFMDFSVTTMEQSSADYPIQDFNQVLAASWKQHKKPIRLLGVGVRFMENQVSDQQLMLFES